MARAISFVLLLIVMPFAAAHTVHESYQHYYMPAAYNTDASASIYDYTDNHGKVIVSVDTASLVSVCDSWKTRLLVIRPHWDVQGDGYPEESFTVDTEQSWSGATLCNMKLAGTDVFKSAEAAQCRSPMVTGYLAHNAYYEVWNGGSLQLFEEFNPKDSLGMPYDRWAITQEFTCAEEGLLEKLGHLVEGE